MKTYLLLGIDTYKRIRLPSRVAYLIWYYYCNLQYRIPFILTLESRP